MYTEILYCATHTEKSLICYQVGSSLVTILSTIGINPCLSFSKTLCPLVRLPTPPPWKALLWKKQSVSVMGRVTFARQQSKNNNWQTRVTVPYRRQTNQENRNLRDNLREYSKNSLWKVGMVISNSKSIAPHHWFGLGFGIKQDIRYLAFIWPAGIWPDSTKRFGRHDQSHHLTHHINHDHHWWWPRELQYWPTAATTTKTTDHHPRHTPPTPRLPSTSMHHPAW